MHNWVLFSLWLCLFTFSVAISPLFSGSILGTYRPGEFSFQCHSKTKIMTSSPITSWQMDGETVADFILRGFKVTKNHGDCSHDIKRHLLLGRKAMTNLKDISKNRDITLPTKVHLVKAMVFPVVTYFCFIDYAKAFHSVGHNKLWKILKEMGTPDHLSCFLRNLYAAQEAKIRIGHGTTD